MELKSGDNDYYAIYKEYKQKYLDLKNDIFGGNNSPKLLDINVLFEQIPKLKDNKQKQKQKIKDYNKIITKSILNESTQQKLKLNTTFNQDNYNSVKNEINDNEIFTLFEQIKKIQDHYIELKNLQTLQKQRENSKRKETMIERLSGVHNSINEIHNNYRQFINESNYNLMLNYHNYGDREKIQNFNFNIMTDMIAIIDEILKPATTITQSAATPAAGATRISSKEQRRQSGEQVRQTHDVHSTSSKEQRRQSGEQVRQTQSASATRISSKEQQRQTHYEHSILSPKTLTSTSVEAVEIQPEKQCTNKNILNFKISDKISKCKFTNKKDLDTIYDRQLKVINEVTDIKCKDKVMEETTKLKDERNNCENKINAKIKYTDDYKNKGKAIKQGQIMSAQGNLNTSAQGKLNTEDDFDSSVSYNELFNKTDIQQQQQQQQEQQEQQEQQKQQAYNDYIRKRQDIDNDTDSDNDVRTESLSGVTTPSSTQHFDQQNYLIKVGDKFLIFDISESQMAKIKDIQTHCNKIINSTELKEFYDYFSTFHQLKEDDEIKRGKLIISKNRFKDLLTEKKIINAYIITILSSDNQSFKIDVYDLSNKSNIAEFNQNIEDIEMKIKNIKACNIPDEDLDKININEKESETITKSFNDLNEAINKYKSEIRNIQNDDNKKLDEVKQQLFNELNQIKTSNNIIQSYTINGQLNVNKKYSGDSGKSVTVGNVELLKLIKTKIMEDNVLDKSVILKLQNTRIAKDETDHNYYKFGEYINKYTPYSAYNNAYILLGLVISHQRYNNFKKTQLKNLRINDSLPLSPSNRTQSLTKYRETSTPTSKSASLNMRR
jgi:hypothetical protein